MLLTGAVEVNALSQRVLTNFSPHFTKKNNAELILTLPQAWFFTLKKFKEVYTSHIAVDTQHRSATAICSVAVDRTSNFAFERRTL